MQQRLLLVVAFTLALVLAPGVVAQRNLLEDVKAARATIAGVPTEEQHAELLNRIAWKNRDDGWGLSRKEGGNRCVSPLVGSIACDILHHKPTNTLYDVFVAVGDVGGSRPAFAQLGPPASPDRVWVAPVDPGGSTPPPPPPPPPADCRLCEALKLQVEAENAQLKDGLTIAQRELDTQRARALTAEAEVDRLKKLPQPTCRAKAPGWMRVGCEIVR